MAIAVKVMVVREWNRQSAFTQNIVSLDSDNHLSKTTFPLLRQP